MEGTSYGRDNSCYSISLGPLQPSSQGFILISHVQPHMAGNRGSSFTLYLEFSGWGSEDVEKKWYLCEAL